MPSRCDKLQFLLIVLALSGLISGSKSEDSLDMGALANIVSTLINQNNQKSMSGSTSLASGAEPANEPSSGQIIEPRPSGPPDGSSVSMASSSTDTIRRAVRGPQPTEPPKVSTPPSPQLTPNSPSSPLNGLMALLPGVLPNLNINTIGGLLGGNNGQPKSAGGTTTGANTLPGSSVSEPSGGAAPTSTSASSSVADAAGGSSAAASSLAGPNPAQSVINQVLTAYASGQIPNELIQLGLSGRIPPQLIELALSGAVPQAMIQMIITGQVPMSTINTVLNSMQWPTEPINKSRQSTSKSFSGFSITRNLFEAIFKSSTSPLSSRGGNKFSRQNILGSVPFEMPNIRRLGQKLGGTISNVASLIPF